MTTDETITKEAIETDAAEEKAAKKRVTAKKETKTMNLEEMVDAIKGMSVLELSELVKTLETTFGISAAPVAVAAAPGAGAVPGEVAAAAPEEEQTEFSVILKDIGANKISVIKAVREITTLGLKEAKELVESAPKTVKEGIAKDEIAAIKEKLETAGAAVEIK